MAQEPEENLDDLQEETVEETVEETYEEISDSDTEFAEYTEDTEFSEETVVPRKRNFYEDEAITFADIRQHISGPLISIAAHIVILVLLAIFVVSEEAVVEEAAEVVVEMKEMEVEPPPPPEPPDPQEQPLQEYVEDPVFHDVPADAPTPTPSLSTDNAPPSQSTSQSVETSTAGDISELFPDNSVPVVQTNNSALKLTGAYKARSGEGRKAALKAGGGGDNTERAVIRALDWLVKVQNDDGSWGDWQDDYNQKVQLTCLALLAMLAHGETTQSERYGDALHKGLMLVLSWANGVGERRGTGWGRHEAGVNENNDVQYKGNDWYAMSRIAIVLAEGYAITRIPALEEGMNRVVTRLINEMNPSGGFGWHWDKRLEKNIDQFSLDGGSRMYNALYSAYNAGCEVSGTDYNGKTVTIEDAIDRAISAISKHHANAKGGFSYGKQNEKNTVAAGFDATGAGTLYLFLMGYNGNAAQKGYEWLLRHRPNGKENSELKMDWNNLPSQTSALGWYYMTQALFQASGGQGAEWRKWNRQMTTTLIKEQSKDGYWECPADKYKQWEVVKERQKNGRIKEIKRQKQYNESKLGGFTEHNSRLWATVYFTLTLEVYYRYLPTFKEDGTRNKEADIANDKKEASSAENADGGGESLIDDQDADIVL
ncbi:MAG: hypothetical protein E7038_07460 [Lentisphaerae bacterium]|nr:hypothetical protein [Lentisphaerota bacterium]